MFRRTIPAIFVLAACLLPAHGGADHDPVFNQIDSIVKSLSEISGLSEEHAVPYGRMTKHQLQQFLTKRIKKTLKPEEIYADELALKMFGLVPRDFDLRKSTISLLTEQAAAFYDYDEKKLFLLEGSPVSEETSTLAHELSHALADQHFDLGHFMEETPANDDENLAHSAVVEGQASWLMFAYDLKEAGQAPIPTADMLKSIGDSSPGSMEDYPVLKGSPLYIQQSLLFPYSEGIVFFDAVYKKIGKGAFSAVFTDPPADSAQIMHPARYFAHQKLTSPDLPKLELQNEGKALTEGSVGEFDHQMLIEQYAGKQEAETLPSHLRGGHFKILTSGRLHKPVMEYVSEWDSQEQATRFFSDYKKALQMKWRHCDSSNDTDDIYAGVGDNGYFVVHLSLNRVSSVEGISDRKDWERLEREWYLKPAARISPASQ